MTKGSPAQLYGYDGMRRTLDEWVADLGVSKGTLQERIRRGMPAEAVFSPTDYRDHRPLTVNGVSRSCAEWARRLGVTRSVVCMRLARGWGEKRAATTPLFAERRGIPCVKRRVDSRFATPLTVRLPGRYEAPARTREEALAILRRRRRMMAKGRSRRLRLFITN